MLESGVSAVPVVPWCLRYRSTLLSEHVQYIHVRPGFVSCGFFEPGGLIGEDEASPALFLA